MNDVKKRTTVLLSFLVLLMFATSLGSQKASAAAPSPLKVDISQINIQNFPTVLFYATITMADSFNDHVLGITSEDLILFENGPGDKQALIQGMPQPINLYLVKNYKKQARTKKEVMVAAILLI